MLVRDLITALQEMPQDAEVFIVQHETDTHIETESMVWRVEPMGDGVLIR